MVTELSGSVFVYRCTRARYKRPNNTQQLTNDSWTKKNNGYSLVNPYTRTEPNTVEPLNSFCIIRLIDKLNRPRSRSPIGHFRITSGLFFEASLGAHPFICKSIFIHVKMSLICGWMKNWFAYERIGKKTRFEKEAGGNSEIAYLNVALYRTKSCN